MEDPRCCGTGWQKLPGALKHISVGETTCWGVNSADNIFYMNNLTNNKGEIKFDWVKVDGGLKQISVSPGNIQWRSINRRRVNRYAFW